MLKDRMRRWPTYAAIAAIFLLIVTLLNSWGAESELVSRLEGISVQLKECRMKNEWCIAEKDLLTIVKDDYLAKTRHLEKARTDCNVNKDALVIQLDNLKLHVNHTLVEMERCKGDLHVIKTLQTSKSSLLDTLKSQKMALSEKVKEYEERVSKLESELENLKANSNLKTISTYKVEAPSQTQTNSSTASTPMATSPQFSKSSLDNRPLKEPALENNAKEIVEETNAAEDPLTS